MCQIQTTKNPVAKKLPCFHFYLKFFLTDCRLLLSLYVHTTPTGREEKIFNSFTQQGKGKKKKRKKTFLRLLTARRGRKKWGISCTHAAWRKKNVLSTKEKNILRMIGQWIVIYKRMGNFLAHYIFYFPSPMPSFSVSLSLCVGV